jgi:general secretion pathway protein B
MSSILKALRKLEEEKSRSREGAPDIARDILKSGPRRQTSPWNAPVIWGAVVLAAGAACILLVWKGEFPSPPARPQVPAKISAAGEKNSVPSASASKPGNFKSLSPPSEPANLREPVARAHAPRFAERETAEPLPSLKLTGIAFQDGRESRLAVVNELPVMEGTMIAGARVVEISRDRVRFDVSGRSFEVLLDEPAAK